MEQNEFTLLNKSYSIESILNSKQNNNNNHYHHHNQQQQQQSQSFQVPKSKKMGVKIKDASFNEVKNTVKSNYDLSSTSKQNQLNTNTSFSSIDTNNVNTNTTNTTNTTSNNSLIKSKLKNQSFESSLILMHKFFKEQKIYTDPNDNYKRRTVVLVRSNMRPSSSASTLKSKHNLSDSSLFRINTNSSSSSNSSGEFGFNLQTYGLLNSVTKETEYICFVNNVQPKSPAKRAGLNNGDVLLAIDGFQIDQFKSFIDITKHVKGKNELRLVIMAENVCKKIQHQQRIEQIKKILSEKKLDLERVCKQEEIIFKKYGINKINIPSPVLDSKRSFSSPLVNGIISNTNIMSTSITSSISVNSNNIKNNLDLITSPNSDSTFLSPTMSSSGIVSESVLSSSNTSASVSNSSSFSSSLTNSSLTNSKNIIIIKNSTPIESYQPNNKQKNSSFTTTPTSLINDSINTSSTNKKTFNPNSQDSFLSSSSGLVRSSNGSNVIRLIKSSDAALASSSSSNTQLSDSVNQGTSKPKSLAKKYFQQTTRLVRSASSSSLNILSSISKLNTSVSITAPAILSTSNKEKDHSTDFINSNNNNNNTANFKNNINQTNNMLKSLSKSAVTRQISNSTIIQPGTQSDSKIILKDATTTASSTDDNFSILIASSTYNNNNNSNNVSLTSTNNNTTNSNINNNNNNNNNAVNSDSFSRIVKLNNNYDSGNFSKKKSLFNKLNNSAHNFENHLCKSASLLKDEDPNNSQLNSSSNNNNNNSPNLRKDKNFLFNILTNKPKTLKPFAPIKPDPNNNTNINNNNNKISSTTSTNSSSNVYKLASSPIKLKNGSLSNSDSIKSEIVETSVNNSNPDVIARIKSNGGITDDTTCTNNNNQSKSSNMLYRNLSYMSSQDDDTEHESDSSNSTNTTNKLENKNKPERKSCPVIDYTNEDYVVTRL